MLRSSIALAMLGSALGFAPGAMLPATKSVRAAATQGPSMQLLPLYRDGELQGGSVMYRPGAERPVALDGTYVGDIGFDPLGFSNVIDIKWLREAEIKHGRVCMLAATGMIVQDVVQFPGVGKTFGAAKMTELHDVAVKMGAMQQLLVWLGFIEIFGLVAIIQTLQGGERQPGDFGFDPLNCGANPDTLARRQLVELKNGRLAMIATGGMLHVYFFTGKGPVEFLGLA